MYGHIKKGIKKDILEDACANLGSYQNESSTVGAG